MNIDHNVNVGISLQKNSDIRLHKKTNYQKNGTKGMNNFDQLCDVRPKSFFKFKDAMRYLV